MRELKLFAPGPVNTTATVKKAASIPDLCHRRSDFEDIIRETGELIKELFNAGEEYLPLILTGSGTASNEAVYSSLCSNEDTILLINNGEFGGRLKEIMDTYKLTYVELEYKWGGYPKVEDISKAIRENPSIGIISMVFQETSTGMINPVEKVAEICRENDLLFFIDGISAVGGEYIDVRKQGIDVLTGVPNKAIGGLPGVSFVLMHTKLRKRIEKNNPKNIYLNLKKFVDFKLRNNQTPNTPGVNAINAFCQSLKEWKEEGRDVRLSRYRENAGIIRNCLKKANLKLLIEDESICSNTVTSVFLPKHIETNEFLDAMEDRGFVFYEGKGPLLEQKMIQIANMGNITKDDCHEMCDVLRDVLENTFGYSG
ncbi:MAG: aminotransferase class V-fold PLP-dependent enzyme [Spirochaetales bacterium]|nr:aminotransferase class V-fold PLP-dependent enzyme [Spirochaetales bacterium]